jgi:hypothetical protein
MFNFIISGIVVEPSKHIVDLIFELLSWYTSIKHEMNHLNDDKSLQLLWLQGLEVLALFCERRHDAVQFQVEASKLCDILSYPLFNEESLKNAKTISIEKCELNELSRSILLRMVDISRDTREGSPLLCMLHFLWCAAIENFNQQLSSTLIQAKVLLAKQPQLPLQLTPIDHSSSCLLRKLMESVSILRRRIEEAESIENEICLALQKSKMLLKEFLNTPDAPKIHLAKLRDLHGRFKIPTEGFKLALDGSLENSLERDIRIFGWLVRALQYQRIVARVADDVSGFITSKDDRVPWDILVSLAERPPNWDETVGDFAYVLLRVKEIYQDASRWQDEISFFTQISLRGGRRREQTLPKKGGTVDQTMEDDCRKIDYDQISKLCDTSILLNVAMPREAAVRSMLDNSRKFERELRDFLGKDYDGPCVDRAAFPPALSLVGPDCSFLLLRLTESSLFEELKKSMSSISVFASEVFADTPGTDTFNWICRAVRWIESLREAIISQAYTLLGQHQVKQVILFETAKILLKDGEEILLDVPKEMRRTLSQHGIFISTNKEGKLTVMSKKGGSHFAVGVTAIRWCPFLLESLKYDVARYEQWWKVINEVAEELSNGFQDSSGQDEGFVFNCCALREEVTGLIAQSFDLILSPGANFLTYINTLQRKVDMFVGEFATDSIQKNYAQRWFESPTAIVYNRLDLLDSLQHRRSLDLSREDILDLTSKHSPFRTAGRVLFERAFRRAITAMELDSSSDANAFCALKAWEIENELFELYQTEEGDNKVTPEYRDQARTLKRSLEDSCNLEFCSRVLYGDVLAKDLVAMSPDSLANARTKAERLRAAAVAKQGTILHEATLPMENLKSPPILAVDETAAISGGEHFSSTLALQVPVAVGSTSSSPGVNGNSLVQVHAYPSVTAPMAIRSSFSSSNLIKKSNFRPPAPPSLAGSIAVAPSPRSKFPKRSDMLSSSTGQDRFNISIASSSLTFIANLFPEDDPDNMADGLLPENLVEKGRVPSEEFLKFITHKLDNGKYRAHILRLATLTDVDAKTYKRFYKDYEARKRIAMFKLEDDAKLFLLTPKFHRGAKNILSFSKEHSTYAVLILKKK